MVSDDQALYLSDEYRSDRYGPVAQLARAHD